MYRDLNMDFRQGGGSLPEAVYGVVRVWGTQARVGGNGTYVVTAETTLKLVDGKATITGMLTNGTGPLYEYAYIIQVEPFCGRAYRLYVAVPDGTTPINLVDLPRLALNNEDGFYVDINEWEALYGALPSRVSALELSQGIQDTKLAALEAQPGGIAPAKVLPAGTDMNTITTPGRYRVAGTTLVNAPPWQQNFGSFDVLDSQGATRITQIAYPQTSGDGARVKYERTLAGGVWYGWFAHNSSRVSTTSGRAIYQWDNVAGREQLIYGDTGVRDITSLATARVSGSARVFRSGYSVTVQLGDLKLSSPAGTVDVLTLPAGFRPFAADTLFDNRKVWIQSSGILRVYGYVANELLAGTYTFRTNDPWPTTLPGTASGTIPNL